MTIIPAKGYLVVAACEEPFTHGRINGLVIDPVIQNLQVVTSVVLVSNSMAGYKVGDIVYHTVNAGEPFITDRKGGMSAIVHESQVRAHIEGVEAVPLKAGAEEMLTAINRSIAHREQQQAAQRMGVGNGLIN